MHPSDSSFPDGHDGADTLVLPFIFVPDGHPPPIDWLARHPDAIRLRATLVPRRPDHARPAGPVSAFRQAAPVFASPGRAAGLAQPPDGAIMASADRSTVREDRPIRAQKPPAEAPRPDPSQPRAVPFVSPPPQPVVIDIFVGGFFDGASHDVGAFFKDYRLSHPGAQYFSHDQGNDIVAAIAAAPEGAQINLIGHSWGADTAAKVAASSPRRINTLITIDPVSMGRPDFEQIRKNTNSWVDVNAHPEHDDRSDIIAGIGDDWGRQPAGFATIFIEANWHHADFLKLLMAPGPDGRSALDHLESSR